jgi:murein DD-endopeptidase MepM/ murein hydrolase activator NlpD
LKRTWIRCFGICLGVLAGAQAIAQFTLPRLAAHPGGVAVVRIAGADAPCAQAAFNGKPVLTLRQAEGWFALVGLALDTPPGKKFLQIKTGGPASDMAFEVKAKSYPVQHLKISTRFMQPTVEDLKRIEREQALIDRAKNYWSAAAPESLALDLPATGRLSARFGLRRVLNGKEGSPHAGLDVAVGTGTRLRAAAAGRVIAIGDYFYSGKSVFVDHGQGFITLYIHMSRIDVQEGEIVDRGATLGLSGATGRVTGPHLHWAVLLNGVYVDPALFLASAQQ